MSARRRHRELLRAAKKLGANNVAIRFKGKHPALVGQTVQGDTFCLKFSDTPGRGYLDRLLMLKLERVLQGAV